MRSQINLVVRFTSTKIDKKIFTLQEVIVAKIDGDVFTSKAQLTLLFANSHQRNRQNKAETYSDRRVFQPLQDIGVTEANDETRRLTRRFQIAVCADTQWRYAKNCVLCIQSATILARLWGNGVAEYDGAIYI